MPVLGIDLGTAHVRAAVMVDGPAPRLLQFSDGAHAAPAVVAFDKGTRVGRAALARAATRPETVVRGVKRLLGRAPSEAVVASIAEHATFGVEAAAGGGIALRLGTEIHAPEDAAAALFRHLADTAEQTLGSRPDAAVLTTPYWFGPRQRLALADAAHRAGLRAQQIVSEGTAIALSLAGAEPQQRRIAIVDAGAGGITASILEIGPARVVLLASAGDPLGGGDDLDRGLMRAVLRSLRARFGEFPDQPGINEMVRQACEAMKRDLAVTAQATAVIPFLPVGAGGVRMQEVTVDRERFDVLLRDTLVRVEGACCAALERSRLAPSELSAVYATGGLANLAPVCGAVERVLGEITSRKLDHDGAVALGAALSAGMFSGAVPAIPLVDAQTSLSVPPGPGASHRSMPAIDMRSLRPPGPSPSSQPPPRTSSRPGPMSSLPPQAGSQARPPSQAPRAPSVPPPPRLPEIAPDAFRLELARLLATVRGGSVTAGAAPQTARSVMRGNDVVEEDDPLDPEARAHVVQRLQTIWKVLGAAMQAVRQYRWEHPQTTRHLAAALREIHEALAQTPRSIRFDVTTQGFSHEGTPIWQPDRPPLAGVPYQLFADGLRKVQLKQGFTAEELRDFLAVLLRDAVFGFAADDDTMTALWERRFQHLAYLAVDSFVDGDDPDVEAQREHLAAELAELTLLDDLDVLLGASVAAHRDAVERAAALAVPEATRARLAAEAAPPAEVWSARYARGFPAAWREAERAGDLEALAGALDAWSAEHLAAGSAEAPFAMLDTLTEAFAARDPAGAEAFARAAALAMFPPARLHAVLETVLAGAAASDTVTGGISRAFERIEDDAAFAVAMSGLARAPASLRPALRAYLVRWSAGHEQELAELVRTGEVDDVLAAMGRLAELGTPAAKRALQAGFESPHLEVRVAAVSHLPDAPAETVRAELTRVLEDPTPEVRLRALAVFSRLGAVAAGPVLVRRIQSADFHALPLDERRALLETLVRLNPRRGEAVAIELLTHRQIIPSQAAEESRRLAAEILADTTSDEALEALEDASKKRWGNTAPVREAAARGVSAVAARRSSLPPPPEKPR